MTDSQNQLSATITWLRFPLIFMVIMLHGYSVVQLSGNHSIYFHSVYPFALWFGETGVPGFFFISGFLFFLSHKTYFEKIKARCHSLLVPYLLWNALLLSGYIVALALGHPQDINGKNMADFNLMDYLRLFWDRGSFDNGNFVPLLCPYWYIRNLLVLSLLSPIVFLLVRYLREVFLLVTAIWWMLTPHNAFIPQSILFFSLGAYFSIHKKNPLSLFNQQKKLFISLGIIGAFADIVTHTLFPTAINLQTHRIALISNIPVFFLLAQYFTSNAKNSPVITYLSNAAFIVFSTHYPIIVLLRKTCVMFFSESNDMIQFLLYLGCVITTTLLSLLCYQILPQRVRNILSGNRS